MKRIQMHNTHVFTEQCYCVYYKKTFQKYRDTEKNFHCNWVKQVYARLRLSKV